MAYLKLAYAFNLVGIKVIDRDKEEIGEQWNTPSCVALGPRPALGFITG
jgi:hypothetical protein